MACSLCSLLGGNHRTAQMVSGDGADRSWFRGVSLHQGILSVFSIHLHNTSLLSHRGSSTHIRYRLDRLSFYTTLCMYLIIKLSFIVAGHLEARKVKKLMSFTSLLKTYDYILYRIIDICMVKLGIDISEWRGEFLLVYR